jgi:protein-S-isoprenylcysteine O-methyltransferase Ste14
MTSERPFQIALCVLFTCFTVIRMHYRRTYAEPGWRRPLRSVDCILLGVLIPYEVVVFFIYLFFPDWLAWSALPLPSGVRWTGVVVGAASLALFVWTHRSLGSNFSRSLRVGEGHTLVTSGPYRWVRHPMYTAFYLLHVAAFALSANWFVGLTWIGGLTLVIAARMKREEAMMCQAFGQDYKAYMKRTGRFLPRLDLESLYTAWQTLFVRPHED